MPIAVSCPDCGKTLKAPDKLAGRRVKCPACHGGVDVPSAPPQGTSPPLLEVIPVESNPFAFDAPNEATATEMQVGPPRRKYQPQRSGLSGMARLFIWLVGLGIFAVFIAIGASTRPDDPLLGALKLARLGLALGVLAGGALELFFWVISTATRRPRRDADEDDEGDGMRGLAIVLGSVGLGCAVMFALALGGFFLLVVVLSAQRPGR